MARFGDGEFWAMDRGFITPVVRSRFLQVRNGVGGKAEQLRLGWEIGLGWLGLVLVWFWGGFGFGLVWVGLGWFWFGLAWVLLCQVA